MKNETFGLTGIYTFRVFDEFGKLKEKKVVKNLVPKIARTKIADRLTNATPDSDLLISHIAIGDDVTAPADGDLILGNETARNAVTSLAHSDDIATTSTVFAAGTATGTHKEAGIFIEGTSTVDTGILLSHVAVDITVAALDSLFIDWRLTISNIV